MAADDLSSRSAGGGDRRSTEGTEAFHALVQASPLAIIALDLEGKVLIWNNSAEQIFGYSRDEVIGRPTPIVPAEERNSFDKVANVARTGQILHGHRSRRRRKDGTLIDVVISAAPLRNDKGEVIGVVGLIDDITERKKAEDILLHFGTVMAASKDAIIGETADGVITAWNAGAEYIYGYKAKEVIGKSVSILEPEERRAETQQFLSRLRNGESFDNYETTHVTRDGVQVDVSLTISPISDANGKLVGISKVARNITRRKRAEQQLETSLSLVRATLEATADGILVVDTGGEIVMFNRRLAEMWKMPQEVLESRDTGAAVEHAMAQLRDPERFLEKVRRYFSGEELDSFDVLEFKDGRLLERYAHAQVVGDRIIGRVFSYRDITHRVELESRLRQAQKMEAIGKLAGGIAHDFNNLLNVIVGYTSLIQGHLDARDPVRRHADEVMKAAERAAGLTRQLLVFSRKQVLQLEVLDLNHVITNFSKLLPRIIGEDIDLAINQGQNLGRVKADPGQIEQVIMNLVVNSRDAMPEGGTIAIETRNAHLDEETAGTYGLSEGDFVCLEVRDSGVGMTPEVQAHIFEPFFTTKQPGRGTGLGLATVYGIVHQSGGIIVVDSRENQGTSFRIYLPRVEGKSMARDATRDTTELPQGTETLLVVEDEDSLRQLMGQILQRHGYTVLEAKNGEEAIRCVRQHQSQIDMLITDVVMPGMRGWEVAKRIGEICRSIKVLYVSGYSDDDHIGRNIVAEGGTFLQKPFTPEMLIRKVHELLSPEDSGSRSHSAA